MLLSSKGVLTKGISYITTGTPVTCVSGLRAKEGYIAVLETDTTKPYTIPVDANKSGWHVYKVTNLQIHDELQFLQTTSNPSQLEFIESDIDFGPDLMVNYVREASLTITSYTYDHEAKRFVSRFNFNLDVPGKFSLGQIYMAQDARVFMFRTDAYPQQNTLSLQAINMESGEMVHQEGKYTLSIPSSLDTGNAFIVDYNNGTSYIFVSTIYSPDISQITFQKLHGIL